MSVAGSRLDHSYHTRPLDVAQFKSGDSAGAENQKLISNFKFSFLIKQQLTCIRVNKALQIINNSHM